MEVTRTFDIVDRLLEKFPREDALSVNGTDNGKNFQHRIIKQMLTGSALGCLRWGLKKVIKL